MKRWSLLVVVAACAHNTPGNLKTGPDGKIKGALPIKLEDGEATVRDIVTYPGGDRIDWKRIELPDGKRGQLDVEMTYTTPRPGLRVSYDLFDQWQQPLADVTKMEGKKRVSTVANAGGKYFIRVYAPKRGDAAEYKLKLSFKEAVPIPDFRLVDLAVPTPPNLPDVPPTVATVCSPFDAKSPPCQNACPWDAPPNWPACVKEKEEKDRQKAAEEERKRKEEERKRQQALAPQPQTLRYTQREEVSDGTDLTVNIGSRQGVTKQWKGWLVVKGTTTALKGGDVKIGKINGDTTVVHVGLPSDAVKNAEVHLEPPPLP